MALEEFLSVATFLLLLGASLTSLTHILRLVAKGKQIRNDFTVVISIFILGWFSMEMFTALSQGYLRDMVHLTHFLVLAAFAVVLTLRWRWALKEASQPKA